LPFLHHLNFLKILVLKKTITFFYLFFENNCIHKVTQLIKTIFRTIDSFAMVIVEKMCMFERKISENKVNAVEEINDLYIVI